MAKSFNKTYAMTIKFSRDDGKDLLDTDLHSEQLRKVLREGIVSHYGNASLGMVSSHIVGEISET